MLVGSIAIVDLRLLGAFRALPAREVVRSLSPLGVVGFLLMLGSGLVLFAADAAALATSSVFRWKLVLIALATLNALVFRSLWKRAGARRPGGLRLMALASLAMWLAVLVLGRWIAYA